MFEIIIILILAIAVIILGTSILKIHPVFVLLVVSFLVGTLTGLQIDIITQKILEGFGQLLGSIGLLVVFGSVLGIFLEKSGALHCISDHIISLFGSKRTVSAMALLGMLVGIPVFCDSGFIILSRLSRLVSDKSKVSATATSLALAGGLYTTHTLVPPTPGPIAAAGNFGAVDHIGILMLIGMMVAIPVLFVVIVYAHYIGSKITLNAVQHESSIENKNGISLGFAIAPIIIPILLIAMSTIIRLAELDGSIAMFFLNMGNPNIALFLGILLGAVQLRKETMVQKSKWIGHGISKAGPILVLTGIGGSFGAILKTTPINEIAINIIQNGDYSDSMLLLVAFALAALIKTSQGSSTSAIVITSSLLIPFTQSAGFDAPVEIALLISAIGSGAMTISHANDSYFWVVTQFSGFNINDAYKGFTIATLIQGITAIGVIMVLYQFLST